MTFPSGKGDEWMHLMIVVGVTEVVGIKRGGLTKQKKSYKKNCIKKKKNLFRSDFQDGQGTKN